MNMEEKYAQALWRMVEDGVKPKEAVSKLRVILAKHRRERLLPRIGRAFERIAAREASKQKVTLSIAHKKEEAKAMREAKEALREMDAEARDVEVVLDETLVGGWRLEGREHLVDASFKKHLLALYNRATQ